MVSIHRTTVINRLVDDVFAYFADVTNDPKWRGDGVKEIAVRDAMGQGANVHQKLAASAHPTYASTTISPTRDHGEGS